jgi:hypothetical protein
MMLLFMMMMVPAVFSKQILLQDGSCFETYQNYSAELLSGFFQPDFDSQLCAIESALGIPTPWRGRGGSPMALSLCASGNLPSPYTVKEYENANNLHFKKTTLAMINNRILFRLMMIQNNVMERAQVQTPRPTRRPRVRQTSMSF